MFRKLLLVLLVVVGLAVIAFAVLLVITPAAPIPEPPPPKPAVERRKAALQADAEGQYVPGYHFVVGPLRFTGFSLRPEALVTFAQTGSGAEEVAGCLERSEEHTSELQSPCNLVCRLLLEKKKKKQ